MPGYTASVNTVLTYYQPATPGSNLGYECDTTFVDNDQDRFGSCIDANDNNPRIGAQYVGNEVVCDNVDNNNDGAVDNGLTGCSVDHDQKRLHQPNLFQGDDLSRVNVVEGNMMRTEVDAVVKGPYGDLILSRTYNSRRGSNDADLGVGWTHTFAVYLSQMVSGDGRYRVVTPTGEHQYFRCNASDPGLPNEVQCVIDDHRPQGNLRRTGGFWYYYSGDGTAYKFGDTIYAGRGRAWSALYDGSGFTIASTTVDSSGRVTQVTTANSNVYLSLNYDTNSPYGLTYVELNGNTTSAEILRYAVTLTGSTPTLTQVFFTPQIGPDDGKTYVKYGYSGTPVALTTIQGYDNLVTLGSYGYDASNRVTSLVDATKNLSITYTDATHTKVTFNIDTGLSDVTNFTHNGLWVTNRDNVSHIGGMAAKAQVYDDWGRITCMQADDGEVTNILFGNSNIPATRLPVEWDMYGKTLSACGGGGGTIQRTIWNTWNYNSDHQSWRTTWQRVKSVYNSATDCSPPTLPSGCKETLYTYASSISPFDDRITQIQVKGTTRLADATTPTQTRWTVFNYYGLGTCPTTPDSYTGLPCRVETQDSSANVYTRTDSTFYSIASGSSAGFPKSTQRWTGGSTTLSATTYGSPNAFGSPTTVTDPAGVVTTYTYNGWNAVTNVTQTNAMFDQSSNWLSPSTNYTFDYERNIIKVQLPKGNYVINTYFYDASNYNRLKAWGTAGTDYPTTSRTREILRSVYDNFGNPKQERILDAIGASSPCYNATPLEDCTTYDVFHERIFNANRQITADHLYASSQSSYDATKTFTYTNAQLTQVTDYVGVQTTYSYDTLGRQNNLDRDSVTGGLNATTQYAYDGQSQLLTTTSPITVATKTEHDDFGQLVYESSRTRGDIRYEYDTKGAMTKKQKSAYQSSTILDLSCYATDWLGRRTSTSVGSTTCASGTTTLWTLSYDATPSQAAGACPSQSNQTGRLSAYTGNNSSEGPFTRVLCYHPNGLLYGAYQLENALANWSNSAAQGTTMIYDANQNVVIEYLNDRPGTPRPPATNSVARAVQYTYDGTLMDRVSTIQHQLATSGAVNVTNPSILPTYFSLGGFKSITYANGITESNTRDFANGLTVRQTANGGTTYTHIALTYDYDSNIKTYSDTGYRHMTSYAAVDTLNRLRCTSRTGDPTSTCSGTAPWQPGYVESFDYDLSGNRTGRTYGQYSSADQDLYTYVTGPTDIISSVTSGGTSEPMSNTFRGEIESASQPVSLTYIWGNQDNLYKTTNGSFAGKDYHSYSPFSDRHQKTSWCNSYNTYYYYTPTGSGGTSSEVNLIDLYNNCGPTPAEYPRLVQSYIYLSGRPIAIVRSSYASTGATLSDVGTYWIHNDQLGTPILVTDNTSPTPVALWRWENDPFGRTDPLEYTVSSQAVSPEDTPAYTPCTPAPCQTIIWQKTYSINASLNPNNMRLHFSAFSLHPGSSRTQSDYVNLKDQGANLIGNFTGNMGAFWTPWSGVTTSPTYPSITVNLYSDGNSKGTYTGFTIDQIEYTTTNNGQFVMYLRMPGQIWDDDVQASYNFHRWYRREDGRYLSSDPIGLAGGEAGYAAYVNSNPLHSSDASGLIEEFPIWGHRLGGGGLGASDSLQGSSGTSAASYAPDGSQYEPPVDDDPPDCHPRMLVFNCDCFGHCWRPYKRITSQGAPNPMEPHSPHEPSQPPPAQHPSSAIPPAHPTERCTSGQHPICDNNCRDPETHEVDTECVRDCCAQGGGGQSF